MIREATLTLLSGQALSGAAARGAMDSILSAEATPAQIAAFLTALRMKGETAPEVAALAEAMRSHAVSVPGEWPELLDTCGTGGDRSGTFNLSTTVAFVAAGAGLSIAKHGNRSASSQTGSADVLEALGATIDLSPQAAAHCLREVGFAFLFAPRYHPAMKAVGGLRRELGFPTVFNLLGPLTNPLRPARQVLGVYRRDLVELMSHALRELGLKRALVVHGHGGLDELSLEGPSWVSELADGSIRTYQARPEEAGIRPAPLAALKGGDAATNAAILRGVLAGDRQDACRDAVLWNASAALVAGGLADDLVAGVARARDAIDSGKALLALDRFIAASRAS